MNCLAIDDEPLALNIIEDFCSKIDFLNLVAKCTNVFDAVAFLNKYDIDLIFLDIQMPHITGLEFVKTIDKSVMIIFTTAFPDYALDGFELNATDYLVKPISFERFFKAVNKAYEINTLKKVKNRDDKVSNYPEHKEYLMIKVEYRTVRLNIKTILYIEGLKDYIKIYTSPKPLLTKSTMKNIEDKLPPHKFMRVHKSYIIAIDKIEAIENNRIRIGEKYIPVGNQYKVHFYRLLNKNKL